MYLHLGQDTVVRTDTVVGIFDTDNATLSHHTRSFLSAAEKAGQVVSITYELPKSFVVCRNADASQTVYLSQLSSATLKKRLQATAFGKESAP